MKRQTLFLLVTGLLLMGFPRFARPLFDVSQNLGDLLQGVGTGLIIGSLFVQRKLKERAGA